jgi:hypothetical protein
MKNKALIFFLSVTAVVLLISAVLQLLTPNNPIVLNEFMTEKSSNFQSNFSTFEFVESSFVPPSRFEIFNSELANQYQSIFSELQSFFNLKPHPQVSTLYTGPEYSAIVVNQTGEITISPTETLVNYTPQTLNLELALATAKSLVKEAIPSSSLSEITQDIAFFEWGGELYFETDQALAQVAQIPFSFVVNDYPVFLDKSFSYPLSITATNDKVLKITISPVSIKVLSSFFKNSISLQQAQKNIESGDYVVISYGDLLEVSTDLLKLNSVLLEFEKIEYRHVLESDQLVPFYVFNGVATGNNRNTTPITIITPAI